MEPFLTVIQNSLDFSLFFSKMAGSFEVLIINSKDATAQIYTDILGEFLNFYYLDCNGQLTMSDRLDAFKNISLSNEWLENYFSGDDSFIPKTSFKKVSPLLPNHYLEWKNQKVFIPNPKRKPSPKLFTWSAPIVLTKELKRYLD